MDAARENLLQRLTASLEELANIHRQLLEAIVDERELLLAADLDGLNGNNSRKESLIMKARMADQLRLKLAEDCARAVGADVDHPRLLEIAAKCEGPRAGELKRLHGELETLISRLADVNRDNARYASSALRTVNGAMNELKETIAGKKTYGGKGQYKVGPETTGNFVSKEA